MNPYFGPYGQTVTINDPGPQPASSWANGQMVSYPGQTPLDYVDTSRLDADSYNSLRQAQANAWNMGAIHNINAMPPGWVDDSKLSAGSYNDLHQAQANAWNQRALAHQASLRQAQVYTGDTNTDKVLNTIPGDVFGLAQRLAKSVTSPSAPSFVSYQNHGQPYYQVGGEDVTDQANQIAQGLGIPPEIAAHTIQASRQVQQATDNAGTDKWTRLYSSSLMNGLSAPQAAALAHLAVGHSEDDEQRDAARMLREQHLQNIIDRANTPGAEKPMTTLDYMREMSLQREADKQAAALAGAQSTMDVVNKKVTDAGQPKFFGLFGGPKSSDVKALEKAKADFAAKKLLADSSAARVQGIQPFLKKAPQATPRVTSAEDYAALPSGTTYIDPDGKTRRKP